jgi:hypothetical protein
MIGKEATYSPNEWALIKHYNLVDVAPHVYPPVLYPMMMRVAFMRNEQSAYDAALRRAMAWFDEMKYRGTPEFEELIAI